MARLSSMLLAVVVFAAACVGSEASYDQSRSAPQIANDAAKALKSARSVHVAIKTEYQGSPAASDVDVQGPNFRGRLTLQGMSFRMTMVAGQAYIAGPDLVSVVQISDPVVRAQLTARVAHQWVLLPADSAIYMESMDAFADMSGLADCLSSGVGLKKKGATTISGERVVEVDDAAGGRLFVSVKSPHYPRRLVTTPNDVCKTGGETGSEPGTIDFSKLNKRFAIKAPSNVVDLASLGLSGT